MHSSLKIERSVIVRIVRDSLQRNRKIAKYSITPVIAIVTHQRSDISRSVLEDPFSDSGQSRCYG